MFEVRPVAKPEQLWLRAWRTLKPSPRVVSTGLMIAGGWTLIHAAQLADAATVLVSFAVPVAIGALLGSMLTSLSDLAVDRLKSDVDWVERIRTGVVMLGVFFPLFQYTRSHQGASTWFAFAGGALVMSALQLMLRLLVAPPRATDVPPSHP